MTTHPLSWLRQIQDDLTPALQIPLWGSPPAFSWETFSEKLAEELELEHCKIELKKTYFCQPREFTDSFENNPVIKTFELAPLHGTVHLILSPSSLKTLSRQTLAKEPQGMLEGDLLEGFFQYLLLCSIKTWKEVTPYSDLNLELRHEAPLPESSSFCSDLVVRFGDDSFPARLVFSPSFHQEFSSHFNQPPQNFLTSSLAESLDVILKVEAGTCSLAKTRFDQITIGDFLILDTCSYDPLAHKGSFTLSLSEKPLFRARIKKDKLKILDYCTYFGDKMTMEEDSDLDPFMPDEELDEASFDSLEEQEEGFEEEKKSLEETLSSSLDITLPLVVEAGRIQMPLKNLLALEPGNILELSVKPEEGVYLTVHGKKVAKGELIKIGDALGVKIVEIGAASPS